MMDTIAKTLDVKVISTISYIVNIISLTTLFIGWRAQKKQMRQTANYLNAGYDMAMRMSASIKDVHLKGQAENIASFLKSVVMNSMDRKRDELKGEGEIPRRWRTASDVFFRVSKEIPRINKK